MCQGWLLHSTTHCDTCCTQPSVPKEAIALKSGICSRLQQSLLLRVFTRLVVTRRVAARSCLCWLELPSVTQSATRENHLWNCFVLQWQNLISYIHGFHLPLRELDYSKSAEVKCVSKTTKICNRQLVILIQSSSKTLTFGHSSKEC